MKAALRWIADAARDIWGAQVDGVKIVAAIPWMVALMAGWEFAQHIIEVRTGFFSADPETARAVALDPQRMVLGWIKMALVYGGGFVATRALVRRNHDWRVDPWRKALPRYLPYIAYSFVLFALAIYAAQIFGAANKDLARTVIGLSQVAIEPLLLAWIVAAASDGSVTGPIASAKRTGWLYLYGFVVIFIARLPINAMHQLLNRYASGRTGAQLWGMLAVDALVVGLIMTILPAISVRVAARIRAARAGDDI